MPVIADRVEAEASSAFSKRLKLFRKISHTLDQLPYDPRKE
ncbi:hypothetical protein [Candidatus Arsenophonus triatominarum]|nr:hypothetical protein [Candidatus Arsenophonus triatominarum]